MTIEEAIRTAIDFETRVLAVYREAEGKAVDPAGKRVFGILAGEEQGHLDYLRHKQGQWEATGRVTGEGLGTAIPSTEKIRDGIGRMKKPMRHRADHADELVLLKKAYRAEVETSQFYKRMVRELPAEGQQLFARFVEIEEGHVAIVQAEMDALTGMGFWFDFQEFELEKGL